VIAQTDERRSKGAIRRATGCAGGFLQFGPGYFYQRSRVEGHDEVRQADLKEALNLDKSAISRRVAGAVDGGTSKILRTAKGALRGSSPVMLCRPTARFFPRLIG